MSGCLLALLAPPAIVGLLYAATRLVIWMDGGGDSPSGFNKFYGY